jgi:hypothetical protein
VFLLFLSLGLFQGENYKETYLSLFQQHFVLGEGLSGLFLLEVREGGLGGSREAPGY